jgi:hypothetical protein
MGEAALTASLIRSTKYSDDERIFMRTGVSFFDKLKASTLDPGSIASQAEAAVIAGASIHKPWAILVPEGYYDVTTPGRINMGAKHGVHLVGWSGNPWDVQIHANGNDDAIELGGWTGWVYHMSFFQDTINSKYAIHADAASTANAANDWQVNGDQIGLFNVAGVSQGKAGIGIGLTNLNASVQRLWAIRCYFEGNGVSNPGIFLHDASFGTVGFDAVFLDTVGKAGAITGQGFDFQELAGSKPNRIFIAGGKMVAGNTGAGSSTTDVRAVVSPGLVTASSAQLWFDPLAWKTSTGTIPTDIAQAPAIPTPRCLPPITGIQQRWPGLVA